MTRADLRAPHATSFEEVLAALGTSDRGLKTGEAKARLQAHGPNQLPEPERPSAIARFLGHFNHLLGLVMAQSCWKKGWDAPCL